MPITVNCPQCHNSTALPDKARGKQVRCGRCQATFVIPMTEAKPEEKFGQKSASAQVFGEHYLVNGVCKACGCSESYIRGFKQMRCNKGPKQESKAVTLPQQPGTFSATCPHCQHSGTLPDQADGKKVRCARCEKTFEAQRQEEFVLGAADDKPSEPSLNSHNASSKTSEKPVHTSTREASRRVKWHEIPGRMLGGLAAIAVLWFLFGSGSCDGMNEQQRHWYDQGSSEAYRKVPFDYSPSDLGWSDSAIYTQADLNGCPTSYKLYFKRGFEAKLEELKREYKEKRKKEGR